MSLVITHDLRLIEKEFEVGRSCALTPLKDKGFLLSSANQVRDANGVSWQILDENSALPLAIREPLNIGDFNKLTDQIYADNHEEQERQNYRDANKSTLMDKVVLIMLMPCTVILIWGLILFLKK